MIISISRAYALDIVMLSNVYYLTEYHIVPNVTDAATYVTPGIIAAIHATVTAFDGNPILFSLFKTLATIHY